MASNLKLVLYLSIFLVSCCTAKYSVDGDHWGESNRGDFLSLLETMIEEWEELVKLRDAAKIAAKDTKDSIYIRQGSAVAFGRKEAQAVYQDWFDLGVVRATLDVIEVGSLGEQYKYAVERKQAFNDDGDKVEDLIVLVIFRQVKEGFACFLKSETSGGSGTLKREEIFAERFMAASVDEDDITGGKGRKNPAKTRQLGGPSGEDYQYQLY